MKLPENHLDMIPDVYGAESCIRLSKHHVLIPVELIGLDRHRVEWERLINCKICRTQR